MSYGVSASLQEAIYQHLYTDPDVVLAVGTNVFDALPAGILPSLYVVLGPEVVKTSLIKQVPVHCTSLRCPLSLMWPGLPKRR